MLLIFQNSCLAHDLPIDFHLIVHPFDGLLGSTRGKAKPGIGGSTCLQSRAGPPTKYASSSSTKTVWIGVRKRTP